MKDTSNYKHIPFNMRYIYANVFSQVRNIFTKSDPNCQVYKFYKIYKLDNLDPTIYVWLRCTHKIAHMQ